MNKSRYFTDPIVRGGHPHLLGVGQGYTRGRRISSTAGARCGRSGSLAWDFRVHLYAGRWAWRYGMWWRGA
eukprot:scaffold260567_cov28-Tisochrysis_lutea.AAC.2